MVKPHISVTTPNRVRAMAERKASILFHASQIIVEEGLDALKLRDLAQRADLTVPTIYNLIGGKPEVLRAMVDDLVQRLLAIQASVDAYSGEDSLVVLINKLHDLFSSDERYYRAAFIAGDRSGLFEQRSAGGVFAQSLTLPVRVCQLARDAGLLSGGIPPELLGEQIYGCYRLARQDWTLGYIGLDEFKQRALTGILVVLSADAVVEYKDKIAQKMFDIDQGVCLAK